MKPASDNSALLAAPDYREFIAGLKTRVAAARISAARAVSRDLILLYWDIGQAIVGKQQTRGWGDSVVEMVSADLQRAFPAMSGFSPFNLWRMRQLYLEYSAAEFLAQAVPELKKAGGTFLAQPAPETSGQSAAVSPAEVLSQLVSELLSVIPWGHHVELLKKIKAPASTISVPPPASAGRAMSFSTKSRPAPKCSMCAWFRSV